MATLHDSQQTSKGADLNLCRQSSVDGSYLLVSQDAPRLIPHLSCCDVKMQARSNAVDPTRITWIQYSADSASLTGDQVAAQVAAVSLVNVAEPRFKPGGGPVQA